MKIKIKSKPQDFIVEEIADLPLKDKGEFVAYLLKKSSLNTIELLHEISKKLKIPFKNFSYGGKKDKHAATSQYISIKNPKIPDLKEKNYSLEFCGFMDRPMGPDLINGNKFQVTVRDLNNETIDKALKEIETIKSNGYPNYFDDQRFGSFDQRQGFLAEKILKGHFNGAFKIYITAINSGDKKQDRGKKNFFYENWANWKVCLGESTANFEKNIFNFLIKNPAGFLSLLKQIPKERLSNYFSAYQSYIWNEVLLRIIKTKALAPIKNYPGIAGDYVFYTQLKQEDMRYLEGLSIPTIPIKDEIKDNLSNKVYKDVLEVNGIKKSMFNKLKIRQVFFKSFLRPAIVNPERIVLPTPLKEGTNPERIVLPKPFQPQADPSLAEKEGTNPENLAFYISEDELCTEKKKMLLNFFLPRGSYATMLIKRLFS